MKKPENPCESKETLNSFLTATLSPSSQKMEDVQTPRAINLFNDNAQLLKSFNTNEEFERLKNLLALQSLAAFNKLFYSIMNVSKYDVNEIIRTITLMSHLT